jgi:uncharacterized protein YjbJ (UPF0337 family)
MNKNQVKGTAKEVAGKMQEEFGKLVRSPEQRGKGMAKEVAGKIQKSYGDAEQADKDRRDTDKDRR